jgi:chitin synthase
MSGQCTLSHTAAYPADINSDLPSIAEDTVLALLRERYISSNPYTALSPNALISVNPFAYQPINGDQTLQDYIAEYHESYVDDTSLRGGENALTERRGPHIFRTAFSAYYNMQRTKQDQVVILKYVPTFRLARALTFSGLAGSGKSETRRLAIRAICELSSPAHGKRGSKIGSQVANAEVCRPREGFRLL